MFRIKVIAHLFVFAVLMAACQSTEEKPTPAPEKPAEPVTPVAAEPEKPSKPQLRLNDKNVKAKLLDYGNENPERIVSLSTDFGDITIRLYEETPIHRANFILGAKTYYDGSLFYRVAKDFVVQGGESDEMEIRKKKHALGKYTIPAEFVPGLIHKRGAVAMAREYEDNPKKRSSSASFYIVQGQVYSRGQLRYIEQENGVTFNEKQIKTYTTVGGNPSLDGVHTVIGEVIRGMDAVDKISKVKVDHSERPNTDVIMQITEIR